MNLTWWVPSPINSLLPTLLLPTTILTHYTYLSLLTLPSLRVGTTRLCRNRTGRDGIHPTRYHSLRQPATIARRFMDPSQHY
uniref:Uncharacterized protein n=1 Tax=Picea glauca TaxID=3330 RepID=A0A101LVK7_PICGL|nr:hypothetical protein ABT39_MTgene1975 [Picea glauca]QHR88019.1 hypothetical protein Q903MT_gene2031 [Picea sitchensis]